MHTADCIRRDAGCRALRGIGPRTPHPGWAIAGGLAALRIAQLYPDAYDTVLVQSPSLWWRPERKAVPTDNNLQNYSWITEEFLSQQVMPRIHIDVGVREDVGVAKAFLLARKLESCSWPHNLTVYEGGHDFVSWRAQLLKHVLSWVYIHES